MVSKERPWRALPDHYGKSSRMDLIPPKATRRAKTMFHYSSLLLALDLNLFRATCLHLNLTILDSPAHILEQQRQQNCGDDIISRILNIIDDICATIPCIFYITRRATGTRRASTTCRGSKATSSYGLCLPVRGVFSAGR
jgi:hypothetical protein